MAYVTGLVNQQPLLQIEYLEAENRILKARLQPGWRLSDGERATLAEIGKRLGRKGLEQVARLAKPDTILAWYRRLVAEKFDGSKQRRTPGRPRTSSEVEDLVVRLARENSGWGYDRIVGALANLGHQVSDQDCRQYPAPAWDRACAGAEQNDHLEGLHSPAHGRSRRHGLLHGRLLTWRGLVTYYVLFFIHLESRWVSIGGITDHPDACWMRQVACNAPLEGMGHLIRCRERLGGLLRYYSRAA